MTAPAILSYGRPRRRLARVPLLFRARDCEDEDGIFALSYGKRVGLVHTRSGATGLATMADQNGMLVRVPSDWPRLSWEMTSAGERVRALLGEPERTNLVTQSGGASEVAWVKTRATVSANTDLAPDGTLTADRLVEDTSAATSHIISSANMTITANGNVCVSRFLKAGTRSWTRMGLADAGGTAYALAFFDVGTGAMGGTHLVGTGTVVDYGIEAWGDGWYRCWVTVNLGGGVTSAQHYTGLATGDAGADYTGDGASYLVLGEAQVENGAVTPSSHIPTGATAVTRAADSAYFPFLGASTAATSLYVGQVNRGNFVADGLTKRFLHIGTSVPGASPRLSLYGSVLGEAGISVADGVASFASTAAPSPAAVRGSVVETRALWSAALQSQVGVSINGGAEVVGALSAARASALPAWAAQRAYLAGLASESPISALTSVVLDYGARDLDDFRELVEVA